ncbi:hypothetical protein EJB05_36911 [Eragrostis curvula]|uniref:Uncharacterized protein n=1 Tax=Eragrostis curvula TaxID=38414 RepID=A0A5J9U0Q9_9POAL|nr:hypothetical protein EJB05_36911 [Eragrostis curvula]
MSASRQDYCSSSSELYNGIKISFLAPDYVVRQQEWQEPFGSRNARNSRGNNQMFGSRHFSSKASFAFTKQQRAILNKLRTVHLGMEQSKEHNGEVLCTGLDFLLAAASGTCFNPKNPAIERAGLPQDPRNLGCEEEEGKEEERDGLPARSTEEEEEDARWRTAASPSPWPGQAAASSWPGRVVVPSPHAATPSPLARVRGSDPEGRRYGSVPG